MKYHQTDENGFLVGEFDADPSPAEPGAWLIQAGGVLVAPPAVGVDQAARWVAGAWQIVPDLKGRKYWTADHQEHVIEQRGQGLPAGAFWADPPKTAEELAQDESNAAKAALVALDAASIRDIRAWIAAQPTAPQLLKDRETQAAALRAKVLT